MVHQEWVRELLEEILESGRAAEEVCAPYPELLGEVRERLQRLRDIEGQIDSLFPLPETIATTEQRPAGSDAASLPSIQGYEIQTILGRGGMGVVYQARHLKLNRVVALKMLLAGPHATRQEHLRFLREAEAVAGLRHPNIVQVYDFGEIEGQPYFTMEYVERGSLAQKMAGQSQPVRESAQMVATLAQAVFLAHQSGIVHRDLKPANILLVDDSTPKISDFGLARRLNGDGGLTQAGDRIGTPSYMAPEQITGNSASLGPSVDVFALGAILYEMLTGKPPFRGDSLSDTERRLTTEEPLPPSRVNAKVPRDLEIICLKCLEKKPQHRYATAHDLAADLERFLRYEPIRARSASPAERLTRWVCRKPLAAALIVTAVVLAGLIVGDAIQVWALAAGRRAEKSRLTARLESGIQLVQDGRFAEARAILGKLGDGGNEDLRQRIDRALADMELVEELEAIGADRSLATTGRDETRSLNENAVRQYAAIFERTGMGKAEDDPKSVAKRIRESDIREAFVAALDDWTVCESNESRRNWLLDVAQRADPSQSHWDARVRNPTNWGDREELSQLAETALAAKPSVQLLRALGDRLSAAGVNSVPFLQQVQQEHADSFLANFSLANSLRDKDPGESIRFYQAALAIRPRAAPAWNNLAVALAANRRTDEAVVHFQHALKIDPTSARVQQNLGLVLLTAGRTSEAIAALQQAARLSPDFASPHRALGQALFEQQRYAEAAAALRRCLDLLHRDDPERTAVAELLHRCGQPGSPDN